MPRESTAEQVEALRARLAEHLAQRCQGKAVPAFGFGPDMLVDLAVSRMTTRAEYDDAYVERWIAERRSRSRLRTEEVPLLALDRWTIDRETGNILHESGRFFTISGVKARHRTRTGELEWDQPIIDQPEIGILGIAAKKFGGVLHFCLQAKEEPGTIHGVQLSPTVQATYSNYTQAHGGSLPPLVGLFLDPPRERVLFAKLQTEDGGRFLFKSNRNMIVLVDSEMGDLPDGFLWLTLRQIGLLLRRDNLVNACARSVLACLL
jgi:oxidase EvaA